MGVKDVIAFPAYEFPDSQTGRDIKFSAHGKGKDFDAGFRCFAGHGGIGLANQMTGDMLINKRPDEIQGLLFSAPPGSFGVDMKNFHPDRCLPST